MDERNEKLVPGFRHMLCPRFLILRQWVPRLLKSATAMLAHDGRAERARRRCAPTCPMSSANSRPMRRKCKDGNAPAPHGKRPRQIGAGDDGRPRGADLFP